MVKNKNAKRKARMSQMVKAGIVEVKDHKFEILKCVGRLWGKELHSATQLLMNAGPASTNLHEITVAYDDIPFIVLGCKGVGPNLKEAEANAAHNFISFFDNGFLPKNVVEVIRLKWSNATREIAEIVNICRTIERMLKTDTYAGLQQVALLEHNPPEKAWAKQLRAEVKASLKRKETNFMQPATDKPSIFSEAGQKRRVEEASTSNGVTSSTSESPNGAPAVKKSRLSTGSADDPVIIDFDSPVVSFSEHDIVCIDSVDDSDDSTSSCDEATEGKVAAAEVLLNISSSKAPTDANPIENGKTPIANGLIVSNGEIITATTVPNGLIPWNMTAKSAFGGEFVSIICYTNGHDTIFGWCKANNVPINYEEVLVGVEYCGSDTVHETINLYKNKYRKQMKRLDDDIWGHYKTNGQNSEIFEWKMSVREKLLNEFRTAFPSQMISLYAVGSTINGCGSYNSDMDLCLCVAREGTIDDFHIGRDAELKCLRKLSGLMKGKPALRNLIKRCMVVPAKVPIIKVDMHRPYEELDLDININNIAGIYNSHLIHYYSKNRSICVLCPCFRLDSRFPALCLLVKHWAITNGISDAMTGTFNSYSLILLVLHYLQCGVQPAVLPNLQYLFPSRFADMPPLSELRLHEQVTGLPKRPVNVSTCAELLIGFFHYYRRFDFATYAISVRNAKRFHRSAMPVDTHHFMIYVEEPFDGKNTARCVTKLHCMRSIEKAFARASNAFSTAPPLLSSIDVNV